MQFLDGLLGYWDGTASQTPLGELPYDLVFRRLDKLSVEGRSSTNGQAVHTWRFRQLRDETLALDFHSTFGDSHAKGLCVVEASPARGWRFGRGDPGHLDVWVQLSTEAAPPTWHADILLRGKPHVTIAAKRAD